MSRTAVRAQRPPSLSPRLLLLMLLLLLLLLLVCVVSAAAAASSSSAAAAAAAGAAGVPPLHQRQVLAAGIDSSSSSSSSSSDVALPLPEGLYNPSLVILPGHSGGGSGSSSSSSVGSVWLVARSTQLRWQQPDGLKWIVNRCGENNTCAHHHMLSQCTYLLGRPSPQLLLNHVFFPHTAQPSPVPVHAGFDNDDHHHHHHDDTSVHISASSVLVTGAISGTVHTQFNAIQTYSIQCNAIQLGT
jgi:hypothetical protein